MTLLLRMTCSMLFQTYYMRWLNNTSYSRAPYSPWNYYRKKKTKFDHALQSWAHNNCKPRWLGLNLHKKPTRKRGSWTNNRPVLSYDRANGTVTVSGRKGKTIQVAVEDVTHAIFDDRLEHTIQQAIDQLDIALDLSLNEKKHADTPNVKNIAKKSSETPEQFIDDQYH